MNNNERDFLKRLGSEWETATPGLRVQAYLGRRKKIDVAVGKTYSHYDLASLTKIIFSAATLMFQLDEKLYRLADPITKWVDWFPGPIPLKRFLNHSAGLTWWHPFYKTLEKRTTSHTSPEEAWAIFQKILKAKIKSEYREPANSLSVYSDLDLFVLGAAMESIGQKSLFELWSASRERMGLAQTDFIRDNHPPLKLSRYAPTENKLRGMVHDENTFALKGVAPHAGLFGTPDDLSKFGLLLRNAMRGQRQKAFATPETVKRFTTRSIPRAQGDWALGFMMPSLGTASCGPRFHASSVGHTGFTGTSLWYDPKQDLLVSLLSNRVHPTRENKAFQALRPRIHTWICESLLDR